MTYGSIGDIYHGLKSCSVRQSTAVATYQPESCRNARCRMQLSVTNFYLKTIKTHMTHWGQQLVAGSLRNLTAKHAFHFEDELDLTSSNMLDCALKLVHLQQAVKQM